MYRRPEPVNCGGGGGGGWGGGGGGGGRKSPYFGVSVQDSSVKQCKVYSKEAFVL